MSRTLALVLISGLAFAASPTSAAIASSTRDAKVQTKPARPAQPTPPPSPAPPAPPAAPAAPGSTPPAPPTPPAPATMIPPPLPKRLVNIQLEFTITDQTGNATPDKKTVTLLSSDGTWGRIRAGSTARLRGTGPIPVSLNVDARPTMTQNDLIQTEITIEYRPVGTVGVDAPSLVDPTILNQSLTVLLQNGKSMSITQAADPVSDRKIVVEVKATVLK